MLAPSFIVSGEMEVVDSSIDFRVQPNFDKRPKSSAANFCASQSGTVWTMAGVPADLPKPPDLYLIKRDAERSPWRTLGRARQYASAFLCRSAVSTFGICAIF
jgi:hypothetical protein